jgi:hypothetical protein
MMETRLHAQQKASPTPSFSPARGLLQRKCVCGGTPGQTGECEACRKKKLQHRASNSPASTSINHQSFSGSVAPPIVHAVLCSPGQPLDVDTRGFMEPRFGHDFSRVRVHTDAQAEQSAKAVHALAYTVGEHIVFDTHYALDTFEGHKLLAHELVHTIQQDGSSASVYADLQLGSPGGSIEREANETASRIMQNQEAVRPLLVSNGPTLQRQNGVSVELAPTEPEEAEKLRRQGITLPTVSPQTWSAIGGGGNHKHEPLGKDEKGIITELTKTAAPSSPLALPDGPRFVLHDTAGAVGTSWIQDQARLGRGPLAETGSAAFVPSTGPATVTRASLFDPHRPASTQFERGQDKMKKPEREQGYRNVWRATNSTEKSAALNRALANQGLTQDELTAETTAAVKQLNAGSGDVRTAASWAISEICKKVESAGAASVAASATAAADLAAACEKLADVLTAREARIASTVNVEMVQPEGSGSKTTGPLTRLPDYTANQYQNVMLLYFQSALQVGKFPEITTHFFIDKKIGDHTDPRCFDLSALYRMIRIALRHGVGSTYGITPDYGTGSSNNVWWNDTVCGRPHP